MRDSKGHRWSGWPGAFCLYCWEEDADEIALADGAEPPFPTRNKQCSATEERKQEVDKIMNPEGT